MNFDEVVVKESPGLCRCCLSEGCYKDLGSEYSWMNETEIYADMLLECFDISITQHMDGPNGPNRLICEVCITRLRDACNFKKQVLDSEKKFVDMLARGEFRNKVMVYDSNMKQEPSNVQADALEVEYLDEMDFGDDADPEELLRTDTEAPETTQSDDITVSTLPVKRGRGRPRKNPEVVTPKKKIKVAKVDEKPRSSKAASKGTKEDAFEDIDKVAHKRRRDALKNIVQLILEKTTVMPFRFFSSRYLCFFCCSAFTESSELKKHTRQEHDEVKLDNVLKCLSVRSTIKFDVSEISCKLCPKSINNFDYLMKHLSEEHNFKYESSACDFLTPFKLSDEEMSCLDCGSKFKFFGPLLAHVYKTHCKTKMFLCEMCGQGFISKLNVHSHIKTVHTGDKNRCQQCDQSFKTYHMLTHHYKKYHGGNRFKCPKCTNRFSSKYLLKSHLAIVHDLKRYQFTCEMCPKMFTLKSKLELHKRRVHMKEKNFVCQICGFKVFNSDHLKRHMVKHSDARPFECDICKKTFQRKKTLEFHNRIHTNDKRYVCKVCNRAFVQLTSLKLHVRVHHANDEDKHMYNE